LVQFFAYQAVLDVLFLYGWEAGFRVNITGLFAHNYTGKRLKITALVSDKLSLARVVVKCE
jgi:hypothetical protein